MESDWLDQSIVAKRGIGWSKKGRLHDLTEAMQGKYHNTIGPYSDPVLTVSLGDTIKVETHDAFEGAIRTEQDKPTPLTATLNEPLPELTRKIHVDEKHVRWSTRVTLPYNPHIGTLSTSPEIDSINSLTPDSHGGNMDLPDMGPGSITYLPVRTAGGRLFIGDAHACQGDGEVCGTAVEYPSTTIIRVDVIKGWTLEWPRLEREAFIMAIGSARPLEDATRIAYRELVMWLEAEYGFDRWDAYMMLSQCGRVRLGNFVDPKYTVGAGIAKSWLAP
jgi:amidase